MMTSNEKNQVPTYKETVDKTQMHVVDNTKLIKRNPTKHLHMYKSKP